MLFIKNPTDQDVSIVIKGEAYTVDARGQLPVSEDVALAWKRVHSFLSVEHIEAKKAEVQKEEEAPVAKTKK